MAYERSFCKSFIHNPKFAQPAGDQVLVVPDLSQDEAYKNHPDVTGHPNGRFLACSPIISPRGVMIGAYCALDDKPRDSLDPLTVKFLSDMSTTVMNYLDATRAKKQHLRAERMIVGIGSFLEGKGSLRNSWLDATGNLDEPDAEDDDHEGSINKQQQDKQVADNVARDLKRPVTSSTNLPPSLHQSISHGRNAKRGQKSSSRKQLQSLPEENVSPKTRPSKTPLSKEDHQAQVEEAFSRGANIIRESIEVEATIFLDANFGSRGAFVAEEHSDQENSGQDSYSSASGDEGKIRAAYSTLDGNHSTANAEDSGRGTLNPCKILGCATSDSSSVNGQFSEDKNIALSEPFLASLLSRYPQGKIFNFFLDGSISASETSEGTYKNFVPSSGNRNGHASRPRKRGRKYKRTRKAILRQDAETLLQLAPDARSIVFSPLWDSLKGRWYAASIAWTRSPHRVFTTDDELSFMFAFGNSVMAEVHRLGALFAEQAKSSLLAGLSHELRSPLHGIFGMADLLNTSVMTTLQRGFIHTISSCAFTLLGSINQLLEYAKIKDLRASSASAQFSGGPNREKLLKAGEDLEHGKEDENSYVQLDVVMEDAIETVFAGYSFFNGLQFPLDATSDGSFFKAGRFDKLGGVQIILDIGSTSPSNWKFSTRAGAWHVILTNIVGNALKFTTDGYISVSLNASPVAMGEDGKVIRSNVSVTVRDSGCGISPQFLENGLFLPFSQEDSMTIGNGLGLNITQRIVLSLGGTVKVDSQKGVGTEVTVSVDLDQASSLVALDTPGDSTNTSLNAAKDFTRDKTVGIIGLGPSKSDRALCESLQQVCQRWFNMNVILPGQADFALCDLYISPFELLRSGDPDTEPLISTPKGQFSSPVIVICPSPRIAHSMYVQSRRQPDADVVEFISQPCGPRKLAKTFEICSQRQGQRVDSANAEGEIARGPMNESMPPDGASAEVDLSDEAPGQWLCERPRVQLLKELTSEDPKDFELPPDKPGHQADPDHVPAPDEDTSAAKLDNDTPPMQLQPKATKILLVDDNDINLRILVEYMKKLGCKYETASNGEEAVASFKANASSIAMIIMGKLNCSKNSCSTRLKLIFPRRYLHAGHGRPSGFQMHSRA